MDSRKDVDEVSFNRVRYNLEIVRDFHCRFEHDGCRTVFFRRQVNSPFDLLRIQIFAREYEMQVNMREDFRIGFRALRFDVDNAVGDFLARFAQDKDDIKSCTAAESHQHHFHRTRPFVLSASLGRAIHQNLVSAAGFGEKADITLPAYASFHGFMRNME